MAHPNWLDTEKVKIAVVGTDWPHFDSYDHNEKEKFRSMFFRALEKVQAILKSSIDFDFLVCVMPATMLHPEQLPAFIQTIHSILDKRYSVHIQKVELPECGILVDKAFIVILASPICAGPGWDWKHAETQKTIQDVICDLAFQNPRRDIDSSAQKHSLQCKRPSTTNQTVYNHNTGQSVPFGHPIANTPTLEMPLFKIPMFHNPSTFQLAKQTFLFIAWRLT